jgi:tetratricopeptide (TPR) repeat protein
MPPVQNEDRISLLKRILHEFVDETIEVYAEREKEYKRGEPELAAELQDAQTRYRKQADEAIDLIQQGEFTLSDLKHVASTLFLTHLVLRWVLEQQTSTFRTILDSEREIGEAVEIARMRVESGDENGFADLIKLVERNRNFYPLLMSMGFIYLRYKKNLNYAMKYFEKAAASPPFIETDHYRCLALQFLASCHEGQNRNKNALTVLLRAESGNREDGSLIYSIARIYGSLGQEELALSYFERAIRKHPVFYAMALIDSAFTPIRASFEKRLKSYNRTFRELSKRFEQLLEKLMTQYERFNLEEFDPDLGREMQTVSKHFNSVKQGHYSGYRNGIVRFFIGSFPDALQSMRDVLLRKRREDEKRLVKRARTIAKRTKGFAWLLVPLAFGGAGAAVWMYQGPILVLLPMRFPYMEFALPAFAGLIAMIIISGWLAGFRKRSVVNMTRLGELSSAASAVELLEKNLGNFWLNEVAPHVDVSPVWARKRD